MAITNNTTLASAVSFLMDVVNPYKAVRDTQLIASNVGYAVGVTGRRILQILPSMSASLEQRRSVLAFVEAESPMSEVVVRAAESQSQDDVGFFSQISPFLSNPLNPECEGSSLDCEVTGSEELIQAVDAILSREQCSFRFSSVPNNDKGNILLRTYTSVTNALLDEEEKCIEIIKLGEHPAKCEFRANTKDCRISLDNQNHVLNFANCFIEAEIEAREMVLLKEQEEKCHEPSVKMDDTSACEKEQSLLQNCTASLKNCIEDLSSSEMENITSLEPMEGIDDLPACKEEQTLLQNCTNFLESTISVLNETEANCAALSDNFDEMLSSAVMRETSSLQEALDNCTLLAESSNNTVNMTLFEATQEIAKLKSQLANCTMPGAVVFNMTSDVADACTGSPGLSLPGAIAGGVSAGIFGIAIGFILANCSNRILNEFTCSNIGQMFKGVGKLFKGVGSAFESLGSLMKKFDEFYKKCMGNQQGNTPQEVQLPVLRTQDEMKG